MYESESGLVERCTMQQTSAALKDMLCPEPAPAELVTYKPVYTTLALLSPAASSLSHA